MTTKRKRNQRENKNMNKSNKTYVTWELKNGGSVTFKDIDLETTNNIQSVSDMWYYEDGKCYHLHSED
jgi:hypothetical protein